MLFRSLSSGLALMLLADCAPSGESLSVAQGGDRSARSADAFRIVDCLLPAQTRQLGTRLTYMAARRAIKTATANCEARGGEYVVSTGAGSQGALDIWLPLANAGDPQAQTYVGELYERGAQGAPDYAMAALWYQRAADQGYRRAQTNLAVLYETGRGVPRDPQRAVRLYGTAAGLSDEDFRALSVATAPASPAPAPTARLQPAAGGDLEAARLRRELEQSQQQLRSSRSEIASLRRKEEQTEAQLRILQDERRALQQQIEQARAGSADPAQLGQLQSNLAERDAQLDRRAAEIERLRRDLAMAETEASRQIAAPAAGEDVISAARGYFGRYHAVIIGNSRYRQFPALSTPASDARDLAGLLQQQYQFQTTVLTDANRYDTLAALDKLRESLTENDNLLIYYAGRCQIEPGTQHRYWLPVDAEPDNPGTWVSSVEIAEILNAMNVKQAMVIADPCFADSSRMPSSTSLPQFKSVTSPEQLKTQLRAMAQERVRVVLSSDGLAPVAPEGARNSVFTKALIDALVSNRDVLAGGTLYDRIGSQVTVATAAAGTREVPRYTPIRHAGHEYGDFFFIPAGVDGSQG